MNFVYPADYTGQKSDKFKFVPLAGTIRLRREFARIGSNALRKTQSTIVDIPDYAVRLERSCDENQQYVVECAQCIADRAGFTADEEALIDSAWDSEFWSVQPIEEVESVIKIFRGRNGF